MDYVKLYDLENYLFDVVHSRFSQDKRLSAFDFFCIIIWKANRAKSKVAQRLLGKDNHRPRDLNAIIGDLTASLAGALSDEERMRILIEDWEFRLPIASAILTVLWPENFTVYDVRVREKLGTCKDAQDRTGFKDKWEGYLAYRNDVKKTDGCTLRERDRKLWAMSFEEQLNNDISTCFAKKIESA